MARGCRCERMAGRGERRGIWPRWPGHRGPVLGWGSGPARAGSQWGPRSGRSRERLQGPDGLPCPSAEKRVLLVKELQGLTVAQRDHMLRAMPLSLAEKRCLRSVPAGLGLGGPETHPLLGWAVGRDGPEPVGWSPPWSSPDAASACREETLTPREKRWGQRGRRGRLSCCSRLRYACVLVGAPLWDGAGGGPASFLYCPARGVPSPSAWVWGRECPPRPAAPPPLPAAPACWARGACRGHPRVLTRRTVLPLSPQAWRDLGLGLLPGLQALAPWRRALKRIGGRFGSSVLSYFLFLKTLLAFNALLLLPLLAFIVGVQAAFPPAGSGPVHAFTGLELLTGGVRPGAGAGAASPGGPHSCPVVSHSQLS